MDILALLSEQTVSVALSIAIMWFYNKLVVDTLSERRELIEGIRAERKETLAEVNGYIKILLDKNEQSTKAITDMNNQMHALRGDIQKFIAATQRRPSRNVPNGD